MERGFAKHEVKISKVEILPAGEVWRPKDIFLRTPGLKERAFDSSGLTAEETLIPACTVHDNGEG